MATPGAAHLRIARATDHMAAVVAFYRDGLGLQVLASFQDHAGFDGVMLGLAGAAWHLELTHQRGASARPASSPDDLLVLYLPDRARWEAAVQRMRDHGHAPVRSANPYWDARGLTFEDADGFRIVLQQAAWP